MARGRPKKINILEPEEGETLEPKAPKKSVTHIERYTEPIQPSLPELLPEAAQDYEPPKASFDIVLQDFGSRNDGGYIKVYRLPQYAKTGNGSPRHVIRDFCANIPVTPDYEEVIRNQWGAGHYQLELRQEDGDFAGGKIISIAAPVGFAPIRSVGGISQNGATANPAQMAGIVMEPVDPAKQFDSMLDLMGKFRKVMGGVEVQAQPQVQTAEKRDPILDALVTVTLADSEARDKAIAGLPGLLRRPGESREMGIADLVGLAIQHDLVPNMIKAAKDLLLELKGITNGTQTMGAAPAAQTQAVNGSGWQAGVAPNVQNAPGNQPVPGQPTMVRQDLSGPPSVITPNPGSQPVGMTSLSQDQQVIQFALTEILNACAQNIPVIGAADTIIQWEKSQPCLTPYLEAFLEADPENILQLLVTHVPQANQVTSLPHAQDWVRGLQGELKRLSEEGPEG